MEPSAPLENDPATVLNLPPYAETRYSGVEWLGDAPTHWEVRRLRSVVNLRLSNVDKHVRENEQPVRLCNYLDVYGNDRILPDIAFMPATATMAEIDRFRLRRGDVLITKDSEDWTDIGVPAVVDLGRAETDILCGYHCALLRPHHGLEGGYLFWFLNSSAGADQFRVRANGVTRYGLSKVAIGSIRLPLPRVAEQTAIIRFLDHADRRVRRYIGTKEKLIAALEEQKQAVIHQAVTGQIDVRTGQPYPNYKDSNVEWLGDVPEHWQTVRTKQLVARSSGIQMGPFGASLTQLESEDTGYKLYGQENTISGDFHRGSRWISEKQFRELGRYELQEGDLVLTRKGSVGKCRLVPKGISKGIADSDTIRVRLNEDVVLPRFLASLLHRAAYLQWQILRAQRGAVLGGLNTATIANLCIALPPLKEQRRIVSAVTSKLADLQTAESVADAEIERVSEYRARLLADVVTGKLDVREAAASLPDGGPLDTDADQEASTRCPSSTSPSLPALDVSDTAR